MKHAPAWQQILALGPSPVFSGAAIALGRAQIELGQVDAARESYRQAINSEEFPHKAAEIYFLLGELEQSQNNHEAAIHAFQQTFNFGVGYYSREAAMRLRELNGGQDPVKEYSDDSEYTSDPETWNLAIEIARNKMRDHNDDEARKILQLVIDSKGDPQSRAEAAYYWGSLEMINDQPDAAGVAFQHPIESGHADFAQAASANLGAMEVKLENYDVAREALQLAIASHHPKHAPTAELTLALAEIEQHNPEAARLILQRLVTSSHPHIRESATTLLNAMDS
jgi:tetratricopeptide (TPR) repeat protein